MTTRRSFLKTALGVIASIALAQRIACDDIKFSFDESRNQLNQFIDRMTANAVFVRKERIRLEFGRITSSPILIDPCS